MSRAEEMKLPQPNTTGKISLEEAISKRRSQRDFLDKNLSLEQVSQLLWSAQGKTGEKQRYSFRATPSAGALYPMELFILTKEGSFHYIAEGHTLEVISKKDSREDLAEAALGQNCIRGAPLDIVICAVFGRVTQKYGQRGIRYVHMEAGHLAQNIHLQAVAQGLGSVPIGAFSDEKVKKVLSLPSEYEPLYIIPIGYARKE